MNTSKKVVITGTSRGIGLALAKLFADAGHQVLSISRQTNELLAKHPNVTCLNVDITQHESLSRVSQMIESTWKAVDILIHNAGALVLKPFESLTPDDFEYVYKVNVFGVAALTQICLPYMAQGSHVVTISSMGGVQGTMKFAGLAAYSSSKGAVITLSELLAEEYKERGIAFNVLALGAVQTEMLQEAFPGYKAPVTATEMAAYIFDFSLTANKFYNGKVLQVSASTP
jgi:NAD(P)-dependent dehydrogenase (short-subunit alcohol dehydrogenase family)